jgi:hypothetical protein
VAIDKTSTSSVPWVSREIFDLLFTKKGEYQKMKN